MAQDSTSRRILIYFPIIHTQTDMGNLKASVRHVMLKKAGLQSFKRKAEAVNRLWTEIELAIDALKLDYRKVRLYQDALPVCGREADIIRDLADKGSRNHRLLLKLMERGAVPMGTESADLLLEEYETIKRVIDADETGIIFLGLLHDPTVYLPTDIHRVYPMASSVRRKSILTGNGRQETER
jgi:hypothetical protein